jgi:hypothetical protein
VAGSAVSELRDSGAERCPVSCIRACSLQGSLASFCVGVHDPPACSKCDSRRGCEAACTSCVNQQRSVALAVRPSCSVHVCAHVYESRKEGGADDTGAGREFPTLIAHVGVPVAVPHG